MGHLTHRLVEAAPIVGLRERRTRVRFDSSTLQVRSPRKGQAHGVESRYDSRSGLGVDKVLRRAGPFHRTGDAKVPGVTVQAGLVRNVGAVLTADFVSYGDRAYHATEAIEDVDSRRIFLRLCLIEGDHHPVRRVVRREV